MAKIYFLAFLALLVFVAVSAEEQEQEQLKGTVLDLQLENPEEYGWPCSAGGNSLCTRVCRTLGRTLGVCNKAGTCVCF